MSSTRTFDVIIAGAGSVGTPTAMYLAQAGFSVLVIEALPSCGQASNKHAIGGVRATHSDPSKIYLCADSINILSTWQEKYGDDIEWRSGGYSFVAYDENVEANLKSLLAVQKSLGLNIDWHSADKILQLIPGLQPNDLRGGTFSPEDGSASPLKTAAAFYKHAKASGAEFLFNEKVSQVALANGRVNQIITDREQYNCKYFINAAGSWAGEISALLGVPLPVQPEAHEAAITEPTQPLFDAMVVDIRPTPGSNNFYFYQHPTGKIIFCLTPDPPIMGFLNQNTSGFLTAGSQRLIDLMPKLMNLRLRRSWRGTYPMTPDGLPILGSVDSVGGYLLATGLCGQGFMLGPGVARLLTHLIEGRLNPLENACLESLSLQRAFTSEEMLK